MGFYSNFESLNYDMDPETKSLLLSIDFYTWKKNKITDGRMVTISKKIVVLLLRKNAKTLIMSRLWVGKWIFQYYESIITNRKVFKFCFRLLKCRAIFAWSNFLFWMDVIPVFRRPQQTVFSDVDDSNWSKWLFFLNSWKYMLFWIIFVIWDQIFDRLIFPSLNQTHL
jgi:hypothetical protein